MSVIEDGHYEEARKRLMADPIVIAMAEEIRQDPNWPNLTHDDGTPMWWFTMASNREYAKRGGKGGGHIGGVSEAIVRLLGLA